LLGINPSTYHYPTILGSDHNSRRDIVGLSSPPIKMNYFRTDQNAGSFVPNVTATSITSYNNNASSTNSNGKFGASSIFSPQVQQPPFGQQQTQSNPFGQQQTQQPSFAQNPFSSPQPQVQPSQFQSFAQNSQVQQPSFGQTQSNPFGQQQVPRLNL